MTDEHMVTLIPASDAILPGLETMLLELADGEAGFGGTAFGRGETTLTDYLAKCSAERDADAEAGRVPQTTYWILTEGKVVGMLRMRHFLNDALRIEGGHIGYYVRASARRKNVATEALRLALVELAHLGEPRALVTTDPDNHGSIRVIEANGGTLTAQVRDPSREALINQYWIDLS